MPEIDSASGVFGHIRLYTPAEMKSTLAKLGFGLERLHMETNISGYRGASPKTWRRRMYRLYERLEERLEILRGMGDTWYMAFRRKGRDGLKGGQAEAPAAGSLAGRASNSDC